MSTRESTERPVNEPHGTGTAAKLNWLRAGVMGANDGIVSTAGLVVGVAAATTEVPAILTAGFAGLLWCVRDFYVAGRGTLAPWSPPRRLVAVGLYRYSRNPMYVAVLAVLAGWGLSFGSAGHLVYAGGVAVAFQLRVVLHEEPWLARTFAEDWDTYRRRTPRWLL